MEAIMKILMGISAGLLAMAGAAVAAKDDTITKNLDLTGFDRIEVSGVYDLEVRVGPEFSIELSGPAYEMNRVEVSVDHNVLQLDMRNRKRGEKRKWRNHREGVDAVITMPMLRGLDITGVVDGVVTGVKADNFKINISGVGDLEIDGECGALEARLSGVGDLDADALECSKVTVRVSGVGDADVFARDEVDARVSGMGDIEVYGSPDKVRKSGGMFSDITIH
jgi:Putative auto-transporter adhesin, head GIN domain